MLSLFGEGEVDQLVCWLVDKTLEAIKTFVVGFFNDLRGLGMKDETSVIVYEYDPVKLFFTGSQKAQYKNNRVLKPENTTLIEPPICPSDDFVQVFNLGSQSWSLVKGADLDLKKLKITTCYADYDFSKSHPDKWIPYLYQIAQPDNIGDPSIGLIMKLLAPFKKLDQVFNAFSAALQFAQRIIYINANIQKLYTDYERFLSLQRYGKGFRLNQLQYFYFSQVDILHNIKKLIDTLIVAVYLREIEDDGSFGIDFSLECDGLGYILTNEKSEIRNRVRNQINFDHYKDLLSVINDLHNGYKHEILTEQISWQNLDQPRLYLNKTRYKREKNKYLKDMKNITQYRIELNKLVFACHDFLCFILEGKEKSKESFKFKIIPIESFRWVS